MARFFSHAALLPTGWATGVCIETRDDGTIFKVSTNRTPNPGDAMHDVLLPALPNLHSHAFQRAMAGLTEYSQHASDSFWTWRTAMYEFAEKMTPDHLRPIAEQVYSEMLAAGYGSVAEFHYLHHAQDGSQADHALVMAQTLIEAADSVGIGLTLLPTLYMTGDFDGSPLVGTQRRFAHTVRGFCHFLDQLSGLLKHRPYMQLGMALHSLRAVPLEAAIEAVGHFETLEPKGPIHLHIAEQQREVQASIALHGRRPVEWLLEHMNIDARWCLVHATHLSQEECRALAKCAATVGLCPTTEANLGDGLFPLADFLAAGGHFGIGSDSHISVSPIEELRWLEYGQRLRAQSRNIGASPQEPHVGQRLWQDAARGGAGALAQPLGRIESGYRCDLISLDRTHPLLCHRQAPFILDSLVFSGNQNLIRETICGGKVRCRDGRHENHEHIADAYRKTLATLR